MSDRSGFITPTNIAATVILLVSSIWLAWWFYDRSRFVYVNDARVASTMINVSSRIPGWVAEFDLDEGQVVEAGQTLARIDSREVELRVAELQARLATLDAEYEKQQVEVALAEKQVFSGLEAEKSNLAAARAALAAAVVERNRAEKDVKRSDALLEQKMISEETWEQRRAVYDMAVESQHRLNAELASAESRLLIAEANLMQVDVLGKALEVIAGRKQELAVEHQRLQNQLADHTITAAIPGVVDETFINPGEYVYPGQRILMLHNPANVWVKANVKETDIRHIRPGAIAYILVDAFPDQAFEGEVTTIGNSATSQFAMLPSPNPSGNFTKVTQRLEVRIDLTAPKVELKPGMMVVVQIPIADT